MNVVIGLEGLEISHILTVPSCDPDAIILPSGLIWIQLIYAVCPLN